MERETKLHLSALQIEETIFMADTAFLSHAHWLLDTGDEEK